MCAHSHADMNVPITLKLLLQDDISSPTESKYCYVVKLIPPRKATTLTGFGITSMRFTSPEMRAKLKQSFSEQVADTSDYQVGYLINSWCHIS